MGVQTDPEIRIETPGASCSLGNRPLYMDGLFRLWLTDHFSRAENVVDPVFKDRLFRAGAQTGILIEDVFVWTPEKTEKRPAVLLRRNDWTSIKRGINNQDGLTMEGQDHFSKFWQGSHTFFCIAKEKAEVDILTGEVYSFFLHFGSVLRNYFNLLMFELAHVGQVNELVEAGERFVVPITVVYGWEDAWTLKRHAPFLKRITLDSIYRLG